MVIEVWQRCMSVEEVRITKFLEIVVRKIFSKILFLEVCVYGE